MISTRELTNIYVDAHNAMRNIDGLQPQEAFDELLKYLFFKQINDADGPPVEAVRQPLANGAFGTNHKEVASQIKQFFTTYHKHFNSSCVLPWDTAEFSMSDAALATVHLIFQGVDFTELNIDVRSVALRAFLTPELRRGLGIYLTPDEIVRVMVETLDPDSQDRIYDPACGSGTFLTEVVNYWRNRSEQEIYTVWGSDKSGKMLLLSELNLGHSAEVDFRRKVLDACTNIRDGEWPQPNSFDIILTNPPFGIVLDANTADLSQFRSCRTADGRMVARQYSEIVFLEQALRFLKPGGRLGIVIPKSVVTNRRFKRAQAAINELGYVYAMIDLPPETFSSTGTQTTTVVLFMQKYVEEENNEPVSIAIAEISNIGHDTTGRPISGNQLPEVAAELKWMLEKGTTNKRFSRVAPAVPKSKTLTLLDSLISRTYATSHFSSDALTLDDVAEVITTGKTPSRAKYSDEGLFILKVGNLTGNGINWIPRERNFLKKSQAEVRRKNSELMLQTNDILLTSSAHSPKYIAKKVDIVATVPDFVNNEVTFVGELMLIRTNSKEIDPYILLAYLRSSKAMRDIQRMIRGQTAHLHPDDLAKLQLPSELLEPGARLTMLANSIRRESLLASEMSTLAFEEMYLTEQLFAD